MKHPLLWPATLMVIILYVAGIVFLDRSGSSIGVGTETRTPNMISGITCLSLGTGLLMLGMVVFRKRD